MVRLRTKVERDVRGFFDSREFLEVTTPILADTLIPESSISPFITTYETQASKKRELYLVPSPEVYMKRLLAEGCGSIYQISRCFRNGEGGGYHSAEFSMLEWYEVGGGYVESINTTIELLKAICGEMGVVSLVENCRVATMEELFWELEGVDLTPLSEEGEGAIEGWREQFAKRGTPTEDREWEPLFNRFFLNYIEPKLPADSAVVIKDYPKKIRCLAQSVPDSPWAERWELYMGGMELANCYTEEIAPDAVAAYYSDQVPKLAEDRNCYRIDMDYHRFFHRDYPECSGVALGMDRLILLLSGKKRLEEVLPFPLSPIY